MGNGGKIRAFFAAYALELCCNVAVISGLWPRPHRKQRCELWEASEFGLGMARCGRGGGWADPVCACLLGVGLLLPALWKTSRFEQPCSCI